MPVSGRQIERYMAELSLPRKPEMPPTCKGSPPAGTSDKTRVPHRISSSAQEQRNSISGTENKSYSSFLNCSEVITHTHTKVPRR